MLRVANLIAIFLFGLGEIMLFSANRYDPINASILMLAMLLFAISSLRFIFAPFAPMSNRYGSICIIVGFFMWAFFYFDIMALGLSDHASHFTKFLFWFPQILLIAGAALFALWLYPLGKQDKALGLTLPIAFCAYAAPRILTLSATSQLVTAIMLGAILCWLAYYKIRQF